MPELPEVETIARTLAPAVTGRIITAVEARNPGTWQGVIAPGSLHGRRITGVGRRGKVLLVRLEDESALAFHLKMTGRLLTHPAGTTAGPHTRVVFDLDDGVRLFFDDTRKFGYVRAVNEAELATWPFWRQLGPEPLEIGNEAFVALFRGRGGAIKALLLNQTVIAGIGNIYADESLFRAGIRPDRPGRDISPDRLADLHRRLTEVLQEAIAACGSSIRDYRTAGGDAGTFQKALQVYGRGGQACPACKRTLRTAKVAGRTTVYCPHCQK